MWLSFALACLFLTAALYMPGVLVLAASGRAGRSAWLFAPCVSVFFCLVIVFVCSFAGIHVTGWLLTLSVSGIALISAGALLLIRRYRRGWDVVDSPPTTKQDTWQKRMKRCFSAQWDLIAYLVVGIVVTGFVFVKSLNTPESFVELSDNLFHLHLIQSYVDSGNWSPLAAVIYPENAGTNISFYPSVLHILAALVQTVFSVNAPFAENVVLTTVMGVVFPLSMLAFMRVLFPGNMRAVIYGSFVVLGFAAFPWMLLVFSPLNANIVSLSFAPLVLVVFILALQSGITRMERLFFIVLFILGLAVLVFAQTSACFSIGLILLPYIATRIWSASIARPRKLRILFVTAFLVAAALLWTICFKLPFMQATVNYTWKSFSNPSLAVMDILLLAFKDSYGQVFLGLMVLIGIASFVYAHKRRWLVWSYGILMVIYLVCALTDGPIKQFLAGFWYTDGYRIAATAVICAIPMAASGLFHTEKFLTYVIDGYFKSRYLKRTSQTLAVVAIVGALIIANYYPTYLFPGTGSEVRTAIGQVTQAIERANNGESEQIYTLEEREFVEKASELIEDDALVLNAPGDGSSFAYGVNGVNVAYRQWNAAESLGGYASRYPELRENLDEIATNEEVQSEVEEAGAKYVLILENTTDIGRYCNYFYSDEDWVGLLNVDEGTPGFKLLLRDGDMRLYEIEG